MGAQSILKSYFCLEQLIPKRKTRTSGEAVGLLWDTGMQSAVSYRPWVKSCRRCSSDIGPEPER